MKKIVLFLFVMLFCFQGMSVFAQQYNISRKVEQDNKETFDTLVSKADYRAVSDSLVAKGWYVSVQKVGEMHKISGKRVHPVKYVVSNNGLPSKSSVRENADGTRQVSYCLSEPGNGVASFVMDKEGNIVSFEISMFPPIQELK